MRVVIEGKSADFKLKGKKVPLRDVIDEVEEFLTSKGKVAVGLSLNGRCLTQGELEQKETDPMSEADELDFEVVTVLQHLAQMLEGCIDANDELVGMIEKATEDLYEDRSPRNWKELCIDMDHFFAYWRRVSQLVPEFFEKVTCRGHAFSDYLEEVVKMCEEAVKAFDAKNGRLAAELLLHEIVPAIKETDAVVPALQAILKREEEKEQEKEPRDSLSTQV